MVHQRTSNDFVVVFHSNDRRLTPYEQTELRRWIATWLSEDRASVVLVGCCADTSREDRACRLEGLIEQIVGCGVPRSTIRCTDDWIDPPIQGGSDDESLPQDLVWLKVIDAGQANREITSIRGLFARSVQPARAELALA